MFTIKINHHGRQEQREYMAPVLLADVIHDCNIEFSMPCSGNHTCGKCRVTAAGTLSAVTPAEARFLTAEELADGIRLACFTYAQGDAVLTLRQQGAEQILTTGSMEALTLDPLEKGYGIAVDIGTTTVVSYLYRTDSAQPVQVVSHHNQQSKYGADVISRIEYCNQNGVEEQHRTIIDQLDRSFDELCRREGIAASEVTACVITGNTTMLHLLYGLDPRGIAVAPFTPQSLFGESVSPKRLGLSALSEGCKLYIPRSVSSYVGADITCAILASGMTAKQENGFIVDIGTNGEMALFAGGQLKCCSTAAGPAFEGAGIKMGMSALEGAVNKVWAEDGTLRYTTIGNAKPAGICGSGIIDAVAAMVNCGLIDETGLINEENEEYASCIGDGAEAEIKIGDSGVVLTQEDIRKIQLAKSAICAGIYTLIHECGITAGEIDTFYIAGGFGSFINKQSAADMGLIPREVAGRVKVIGNGAGMGASAVLLSKEALGQSEQIAAQASDVELSSNAYFMEQYIDCMMFS